MCKFFRFRTWHYLVSVALIAFLLNTSISKTCPSQEDAGIKGIYFKIPFTSQHITFLDTPWHGHLIEWQRMGKPPVIFYCERKASWDK